MIVIKRKQHQAFSLLRNWRSLAVYGTRVNCANCSWHK